jgi:hypothetical protein
MIPCFATQHINLGRDTIETIDFFKKKRKKNTQTKYCEKEKDKSIMHGLGEI